MTPPQTPQTWTAAEIEVGTRAYFNKSRCSGHNQFNGRYCRDVAGPEQWCIHCAGFVLLTTLAASSEREAALRAENERLLTEREILSRQHLEDIGLVKSQRDAAEQTARQACFREREAEAALTAERQKAEKLHGDLHRVLHKLWTKAVGTEGYVKAEWMELDGLVANVRPLGLAPTTGTAPATEAT